MKKKRLFGVLVCVTSIFFVWACTHEEELTVENQPEAKSELLSSLEDINRELMAKRADEPRGFWDKFARFCAVAAADIGGGVEIGKIGATTGGAVGTFIGGPAGTGVGAAVGGAVGGTIGAVGASYGAYKGLENVVQKANSQTAQFSLEEVTEAYLYATSFLADDASISFDPSLASSISSEALRSIEDESISLAIPQDARTEALHQGVLHNIALEYLIENPKSEGRSYSHPVRALTPVVQSVLQSAEYTQAYNEIVALAEKGGGGKYIVEKIRERSSEKDNKVLSLFFDVFNVYPRSVADVNELSNLYIKKISESSELTQEEKQVLYNAFAVAVHSFSFWEKKLDSHPVKSEVK